MNPTNKAWLIDLDGTLYYSNPVKIMMAMELAVFGWPAWATIRRFRASHEILRSTYDKARPSTLKKSCYEQQIERTASQLGSDPETIEKCVEKWMIQRPGKWLRAFRRRNLLREIIAFRHSGGTCALVSDYPARQKLQSMGITDLFDVIVANGEPDGQQRLKPDPEGFLLAAERLGIAAKDCLVIGDRLDADGQAAGRANMQFRHIR